MCGLPPHCLAFTVALSAKKSGFPSSKIPNKAHYSHLSPELFSNGFFWKVFLFVVESKYFQGKKQWKKFIFNREIFYLNTSLKKQDHCAFLSLHLI